VLTLDTSGVIALASSDDRHHLVATTVSEADRRPYFVPMGVMAEIAYVLENRVGTHAVFEFLGDVRRGSYVLDCGDDDIPRIDTLIRRYADLRLGFSDAAVIACAERHGGRVLTLDRRHFPVVARGERTITILPEQCGQGLTSKSIAIGCTTGHDGY